MVISEEDKRSTAYHESGHVIVGELVEGDPIYKVSIIPRGQALGVTMPLPEKDKLTVHKDWLEATIAMAFGGRVAELLIYGPDKANTGASDDIRKATDLARKMVTQWGLSDSMGPLRYSDEQGEVFLGHSVTQHKSISEETARKIDVEVRRIVDRNYQRAEKILKENIDILHAMADALMKFETLNSDQIGDVMAGKPPREPPDDDAPTASEAETKSEQEPKSTGKSNKGDTIGGPAGQH